MSFLDELNRRNVIRVALAYLAASWLLVQVAATVLPAYGAPPSVLPTLISVLAIGFVPALVLAWVFEWTPQGLRRDSGRSTGTATGQAKTFDRVITTLLVLAVGYFALDKFIFDPARDREQVSEAREQGRADALVGSYGDKSIAVLPFVNMSSDPEQEYFSDGIAEEILNLLARIEGLRVISRSSAFSYKGKDVGIAEIASALRVAHVLEGSVRRSGDRIRVTAQLVDARSDANLWSAAYDQDFSDIFAIQDEIAAAVAGQLQIRLMDAAPTVDRADPEAYALTLHGRYLLNSGDANDVERARVLTDQALLIDPDYVSALIQKRRLLQYFTGGAEAAEESRSLLQRIVAIEPFSARSQILQSTSAMESGDVPTAARFLQMAMDQQSSALEVLHMTSSLLAQLGYLDEAIAIRVYIIDRDPACIICRYVLGASYRNAGDFERAEEQIRSAIALVPDGARFRLPLLRTRLLNGKAQEVLDGLAQEATSNTQSLALRAMALHSLGRVDESRAALDEVLISDDSGGKNLFLAETFAWLGDADSAFAYLDKAIKETYVEDVFYNRFFDGIDDDPRWHAMLQARGIAPEQVAALNLRVVLPPGVRLDTRH